jgi:ribonucleoside-diphosphate reductase alpha chain
MHNNPNETIALELLEANVIPESAIKLTLVKRNGTIVPFDMNRIKKAIELAFRDTKKIPMPAKLPEGIEQTIERLSLSVIQRALELGKNGVSLTVEGIQDIVEVTLMKNGYHDVARDYIIYRDKHKAARESNPTNIKVLRKDGITKVRFNPIKVSSTFEEIFRETGKHSDSPLNSDLILQINDLTEKVVARVIESQKENKVLTINALEDLFEETLMKHGYYPESKYFIIIRKERDDKHKGAFSTHLTSNETRVFSVVSNEGNEQSLSEAEIRSKLSYACRDLKDVSVDDLIQSTLMNFYDGIKETEIDTAMIMAARSLVEVDPAYSKVCARLLLDKLYREALEVSALDASLEKTQRSYFISYIQKGISLERLSPKLLDFDLEALSKALDFSRDDKFQYIGLQTLYDRYFIHNMERRMETPQIFWMRVAMGLCLNEKEKTAKTVEFYNILSQFSYTPGTPTLFNSGTSHSQLSSCYLSTVNDDLSHIFKVIADDAQLSKWAGGLGNDWTSVRATGSIIKGTNGKSQGVIPFLKVANDTAVAVNQGGKRKGALCSYLETWHLDIEDFLELRKNTGDERRRTHDMNTANWIPDLFMKRVNENGVWTLFTPSEAPDLHDLYGEAFEKRYVEYEADAAQGKMLHKKVDAVSLWRKMISMLFETGHPWITFKDPSNIRSPQDHAGVVHSSNLCTEILLNTSKEEVAVCNIGSVNLVEHFDGKEIDEIKLAKTVRTAIRMLDNVIDVNFYPIPEAEAANKKHRAIGIGLMGFQDILYMKGVSYASHEAIELADKTMEMISYYAILASSELAKERGTYGSYEGSKWSRGLLPIDTISLLEKERNMEVEMDKSTTMNWQIVRDHVAKHGMRNCNTMAIAPTATIANIVGVTSSIEPTYKNLFVKSNLSGEFTIPNNYLIEKLKQLGLWNPDMLDDLKYYDGSLAEIEDIPREIKDLFLTAFEVDPDWIIECGSRRQKWIDMGQSLNLYLSEPSGKKLNDMYMKAWRKGLKTTYYLRTLSATQIEKSTTDINKRGIQPRWMKNASASSNIQIQRQPAKPKACSLGGEGCESCQ